MSQSTLIAGAIFTAWVVYITLRGELPTYLGVFGLGAGAALAPSGSTDVGGVPGFLPSGSLPGAPPVSSSFNPGQATFPGGSALNSPFSGVFQDTGGTLI